MPKSNEIMLELQKGNYEENIKILNFVISLLFMSGFYLSVDSKSFIFMIFGISLVMCICGELQSWK